MTDKSKRKDDDQKSREFFRIHYRTPENPVLEINKTKFVIIDISEGGIKFVPKKGSLFFENDFVEGKVVFGVRGAVDIKGLILRVTRSDIVIKLEESSRIPLARIMEEQRFLIQKGKL